MKILVIGSGAREHALVWRLAQSPKTPTLFCAPGNAGIAELAELVPHQATDVEALAKWAKDRRMDLTIVGPEMPLVAGIVDVFLKEGLRIFGPTQAASRLEGSKVFAKQRMQEWGVPTAEFEIFNGQQIQEAKQRVHYYLASSDGVVVKADGVCGGKGAFVCDTAGAAHQVIEEVLAHGRLGKAGERVVEEELLQGREVSFMVVSDGQHMIPLATSQDHKRLLDDDHGPNTGGMGACSPAPGLDPALEGVLLERTIRPVIEGMRRSGTAFRGVLYAGVMLTEDDGPQVLEYNVRFGDPETQVILPRLQTDLVEVVEAAVNGQLKEVQLSWDPRPCVGVVLASEGYPEAPVLDRPIEGLAEASALPDVLIFHAGTRAQGKRVVTAGGRVLTVVARGATLGEAARQAYAAVEKIHFEGKQYRQDIGRRSQVVG